MIFTGIPTLTLGPHPVQVSKTTSNSTNKALMATPGRQINCQPNKTLDIKDLNEVISTLERSDFPEGRWSDLGLRLHISQPKLDAVGANNSRDVKACLKGCLILWLQQDYDADKYGKPSLEKLATAVKKMGLKAVADKIAPGRIEIETEATEPEESSGLRMSNTQCRTPVTIKSEVKSSEFRKLRSAFAALVTKVRRQLAEKVSRQLLEIIEIATFIEEMIVEDVKLTDEVSIDVLFNRIKIYYSYHNYSLIEGIVDEYFEKSSCMEEHISGCFTSHPISDACIIRKMEAYIKKLDDFMSYSLKDLRSTIEATFDQNNFSSDTAGIVVIMLNGGWDEMSLNDFESLLKHYFTRRNIFNHLQISPGSVRISYLVPRSAIAHITKVVKSKSESMRRVGVFYFSINDDVLLDEKDNVDFDKSIIEAVKLDKTFEVSLLLSLRANSQYEDSNGDKVLELAIQGGNEEIIELISVATDTQVMKFKSN